MTTPRISVVIPCYNDGRYLPETIGRIKRQTFTDYEIIVVNDGSTDEYTLDILRQLAESGDAQVLHKPNGRMSSARNHGARHARGSIIATIDADDYYHPTFFQKAVDILDREPEIGVVTSYVQLFGEFRAVAKPRARNAFNLMFSSQVPACAVVRKAAWDQAGGYDEEMKLGYEDWEFYIRVSKNRWRFEVIPEKLLFYRQTAKSTLKNATGPNRAQLIDYIVNKHRDWYVENLKILMVNEEVLYTETRISYPRIIKFIKDRLNRKYP